MFHRTVWKQWNIKTLNLSTNITQSHNKIDKNLYWITNYSFKSSINLSAIILKIIHYVYIDILLTIMIKNNINFLKTFSRNKNLIVCFLFFLYSLKLKL